MWEAEGTRSCLTSVAEAIASKCSKYFGSAKAIASSIDFRKGLARFSAGYHGPKINPDRGSQRRSPGQAGINHRDLWELGTDPGLLTSRTSSWSGGSLHNPTRSSIEMSFPQSHKALEQAMVSP